MSPRVDPTKRLRDLELVFSALAHPARRQILLTVHFWGGTMCAGDVARRFGHSWPTTTRHLGVLVDAGLMTQERLGRTVRYRLRRDRLRIIEEWLGWFEKAPASHNARDRMLRVVAG
jgi:DNA-binding transcriptional ArsR family regulator